ncbi:MAG: ISAzo13 family transposase, partial [Chloroflexi bacterium]|nr:ISAzo13 family transposase [Chloroflexota bacterium]
MIDEGATRSRFAAVAPLVDERARRLFAGTEAATLGRGGISAVARATGLARTTVQRGVADVRAGAAGRSGRVRREGAGRPRATERDVTLRQDLEALIEPTSRGDPESPLRWTCKSVRKLAAELGRKGHLVSHQTVSELLQDMGYSLQANRKVLEGSRHPDRNAQFAYLNEAVQLQLALGEPVISVDTKKKELVGPFRNSGKE